MKTAIRRLAAATAVLACAALTAGCLVKETTHTISLEPDGSGTWIVLEQHVHAVGDTPADRLREEEDFLAAARANSGRVRSALRTLGAFDAQTRVVSDRWPYAVVTEGHFEDVAALLQAALDSFVEVDGESVLTRQGDRVTWTVVVEYDPDTVASSAAQQPDDRQDAVEALFAGADDDGPMFFIRHAEFVHAVGFTIEDDGRVATLDDLSEWDWEEKPRLELSLSWVAAESHRRPK